MWRSLVFMHQRKTAHRLCSMTLRWADFMPLCNCWLMNLSPLFSDCQISNVNRIRGIMEAEHRLPGPVPDWAIQQIPAPGYWAIYFQVFLRKGAAHETSRDEVIKTNINFIGTVKDVGKNYCSPYDRKFECSSPHPWLQSANHTLHSIVGSAESSSTYTSYSEQWGPCKPHVAQLICCF